MSAVARPLRDPQLPGLSVALDPETLLAELRARLPECREGAEALAARVKDLRYRPGMSATLLVEIELRKDGQTLRPRLVLHVLPPHAPAPVVSEASLSAHRRCRQQRETRHLSPLADAVQHWDELGLHLHAFPVDPELLALSRALDLDFMRGSLQRVVSSRRVRELSVQLMSYTPRSRAALRYELLCDDESAAPPERRRLVGKLQGRKPPEELFAGHHAVWRACSDRATLARPVAALPSAGLCLQELLEGRPLSRLAGKPSFLEGVRGAARGIAAVNDFSLPLLRSRDAATECRTVERWTRVLSVLRPDLQGRLARHSARLSSALESRFRARGTVHADFHLGNVLVDGGRVALIDWDQAAHGDPALDPGRFLGALRVSSLRVTGTPNGLADAGEAFLDGYLAERDEEERQVRLFESLALMIASASPFRLQRQGWRDQVEALLAESESALTRALSGPPLAVTALGSGRLPVAERRDWALDGVFVASLLAPLLRDGEGSGLELAQCRPKLLHETPRSLRLRWHLEGRREGAPWRRALDGFAVSGRSCEALARELRAVHAVAGDGDHASVLPRPLGSLEALSLLVVDPAPARSLAPRLGREEAASLLKRFGRAFGRLARLEVGLEETRVPQRDLREIGRRVQRLEAKLHPASDRLRSLLERARDLAETSPAPMAPTPWPLALSDLVFDDERVGLRVVRGLVAAPAGTALGSLLAALQGMSLRGEAGPDAAECLRVAFLSSSGLEAADVAGSEALALLRRALGRHPRHADEELRSRLLELAERRLDLAS